MDEDEVWEATEAGEEMATALQIEEALLYTRRLQHYLDQLDGLEINDVLDPCLEDLHQRVDELQDILEDTGPAESDGPE